jgi:hypothetical protein
MLEENNQGGIYLSSTIPITTGKTKHIDIRYHFVRGLVKKEAISMEWLV